MAYIPDLSPYTYRSDIEYGPILAVGWLDPAEPYPQGEVPITFLAKLNAWCQRYGESTVAMTRGFHENELTATGQYKETYRSLLPGLMQRYLSGNGEFHVKYGDIFYSVPVMILEYIVENGYCPPDAYIQAVLHGELVKNSKVQQALMKNQKRLEKNLQKNQRKHNSGEG